MLNATLIYNDTSLFNFGPPWILRLANPLRALLDSFLNVRLGATNARTYSAAMTGVKEMPKIANFLNLDLGATMGPFFFGLAFHILFPTMVVGFVYEKEVPIFVCVCVCIYIYIICMYIYIIHTHTHTHNKLQVYTHTHTHTHTHTTRCACG